MTITQIRQQLETALTAETVRVMPQGAANPPSVFITPGPAWLLPSKLGGSMRLFNWSIIGVVGAGSEVAIEDQEALADAIYRACMKLPGGWTIPNFDPPGSLKLAGLPYIGFRAAISFQG